MAHSPDNNGAGKVGRMRTIGRAPASRTAEECVVLWDANMRKAEINNEIVSLRQTVRQARICVINKLVREAKRLRTNSGNEKQLERNKNKADKLLREVFALKRIKDDEISKFGIVKFENLQAVIQNPRTDDGTRAMAKVVRYKSLSSRITEFVEKYPDYGEFVSWRKRRQPTKKKENAGTNFQKKHSTGSRTIAKRVKETAKADLFRTAKPEEDEKARTASEESEETARDIETSTDIEVRTKVAEIQRRSKNDAKLVSEQASVKRLTEIVEEAGLNEQDKGCEETEKEDVSRGGLEFPKREDDFFLDPCDTSSASSATRFPKAASCSSVSKDSRETFLSQTSAVSKDGFSTGNVKGEDRHRGRRGTVDRNVFRGNGRKRAMPTRYGQQREKGRKSEESGSGGGAKNQQEDSSLHPSWAAKKKQQDMMKQGFQGKRIKFDED